MSYSVVFTHQAESDLRQVYEYIAYHLVEPITATHQTNRIIDGILSLNEMPERYRCLETEQGRGKGIRIMPIDRFSVIYLVDNDGKTVSILRVLYGGRDIDGMFKREH